MNEKQVSRAVNRRAEVQIETQDEVVRDLGTERCEAEDIGDLLIRGMRSMTGEVSVGLAI